jgi:predicted TIM-barrel fold metal-dependent hydrolase
MNKITRVTILLFFLSSQAFSQATDNPLPIIDMHLHAFPYDWMGNAPVAFCLPTKQWPVKENGKTYKETFISWETDPQSVDPDCEHPIWSPESDDGIMNKTFEIMERRNVIGVASGPLTKKYQEENPDRIIPGLMFNMKYSNISPDSLKQIFSSGDFQVFGEITNQYSGIGADDERFHEYLKVASELDIPVGIHIGPGPPGIAYVNSPHYRGKLHDPLQLEEALLKFPDLRIYICHAGWPMIDNLLALMWSHPQVYVDIGVIVFALPPKEFHNYLRRIVEAGFGNRVMFGSDQMVWPEALEVAIQTIEDASYLTDAQKRDIFYNNAARFLNLSKEMIDKHHHMN